jgi:hypothetical protein
VRKYTDSEAKALDQLIMDCTAYDFDTDTALFYIRKRFTDKKEVTREDYLWRKRRLERDSIAKELLDKHNTIGFVLEHEEMRRGIKLAVKQLSLELFRETSLGSKERDRFAIAALAKSLNELTITWQRLNIDLPYVAAMKEELDRARNINSKIIPGGTIVPIQKVEFPPSALVIGMDTIAGKVADIPETKTESVNPDDTGESQVFE